MVMESSQRELWIAASWARASDFRFSLPSPLSGQPVPPTTNSKGSSMVVGNEGNRNWLTAVVVVPSSDQRVSSAATKPSNSALAWPSAARNTCPERLTSSSRSIAKTPQEAQSPELAEIAGTVATPGEPGQVRPLGFWPGASTTDWCRVDSPGVVAPGLGVSSGDPGHSVELGLSLAESLVVAGLMGQVRTGGAGPDWWAR